MGGDGYSTTNMGHYEITVLVLFAQFRCSPDGGLLLVEHVHVAGAVDIVKTGDPGHILEFIRVWGMSSRAVPPNSSAKDCASLPPRMAGWTV